MAQWTQFSPSRDAIHARDGGYDEEANDDRGLETSLQTIKKIIEG